MTDKLKVGPELDARIATEVMGWRFDERWGQIVPPEQKAGPHEIWQPCWDDRDRYEIVDANVVDGVGYTLCDGRAKIMIPSYSTDIADAWRVLESFAPDCIWAIGVHASGYYAAISGKDAEAGPMQIAATAPLAICRAALFWHAEQKAVLETYGAPPEVRAARLAAVREEFLHDQPLEPLCQS